MKSKALYSILVIFLVTFFLFYRLKNPNLYTPKFELEKNTVH